MLLPSPQGKGVIICRRTSDEKRGDEQKCVNVIVNISLYGYPRDGFDLKSVFHPPTDGHPDSVGFGEGPSSALATCKESILGVKWGTPGRLLPPAHPGLELLVMTESAVLHAVKIPTEVVKRCCMVGARVISSQSFPDHLIKQSSASTPREADKGAGGGVQVAPKYPLRKSITSMRSASATAVGRGRGLLAHGHGSASANMNTLNSTSSLRYDNTGGDSVVGEYWQVLQREALVLEENLQNGLLEGLSIGRVDQYARQITLEMGRGAVSPSDRSRGSVRNPPRPGADAAVALIISFPPRFPLQGLPSFTIRGADMGTR
jgi:hypothetical protein